MKTTIAVAALMLSAGVASAAPTLLDLSSGVDSNQNGTTFAFDTYDENGYRIQMDRAGDHIDRGFLGDLGFHNGPVNPDNISWTLSFGGNAFRLLDIDIGAFSNGALSVTLRGSNGATQSVGAVGLTSIFGMDNVTFVQFDIDQDGGIQSVGLNGLTVDPDVRAVPIPGTLALLGLGLVGLGVNRRKTA